MLRLPWVTARRSYLRSFSTTNPPPNDELEKALSGLFGLPSSAPAGGHVPNDPPKGPEGQLPPGGPPLQPSAEKIRADHALPASADSRIYHLHVSASPNNTVMTFTDAVGNPRAWVSAGSCGFKHAQRSGYEAGYQCAVKMFGKIAKERQDQHLLMQLEILFKGFGNGREALFRALMASEGDMIRDAVIKLTDSTPLKIGGGTREKKMRRL